MEATGAAELLSRLHRAQNGLYAGGGVEEVARLLHPDVVWVVPGDNAIAGTYRGREQVMTYFRRRRDQAAATFHIERRELLTGSGDLVASVTDGVARLGGRERRWSTVDLYLIQDDMIRRCWLLPLDPLRL
jgi:hypothetical protein